MTRSSKRWLAVALTAALLATGAMLVRHTWAQRELIVSAIPPPPAVPALPPEFTARIAAAAHRAAQGPGRLDALEELSRLYHANGFSAEASRCYDALLRLKPANARWMHRHASLLATYGELEAAISRWQRVVELAPEHTPAGIRLGDALLKRGDFSAAGAAYTAVLARHPSEPHAQIGLARIDIAAARWPAARERLERVVAETDYKLGYDLLPTVCEQQGDVARAAVVRARQKASGAYSDVRDAWLDELFDDCFDANRLAVAGGTAAKTGDRATAVRLLERAIALAPANEYFRYQVALQYFEARDYQKASEHLERSVALAPAFADGWICLAQLRTVQGDPAGAQRLLATGLRQAPDSPGLRLANARRLASAKRFPEAIAEFRTAIRLRPTEADAWVELAGVHFAAEQIEAGGAALRSALAAEPDFPAALTALAFLAINLGDEAQAREWLQRIRQQPRVPSGETNALLQHFQQRFRRGL